jgi:hypothetical protein
MGLVVGFQVQRVESGEWRVESGEWRRQVSVYIGLDDLLHLEPLTHLEESP